MLSNPPSTPQVVTIRLADGESRSVPVRNGTYLCPWCEAPVVSPETWERDYHPQRYPSDYADAWKAQSCASPACWSNQDAAKLAALREQQEREAAHKRAAAQLADRKREYVATRDQRHQHDDAVWASLTNGNLGNPPQARRGDLLIVRDHNPGYGTLHGPADEYTVGVVTGITRDGAPKFYKPATLIPEPEGKQKASKGTDLARHKPDRVWAVGADVIDVPGAIASASCGRTFVGRFGSMDDVAATLRPHLKTGTSGTWKTLSAAAKEWEEARRRAHEQYSRSVAAGDSPQAWETYKDAIKAASEAYEHAVAKARTALAPLKSGDAESSTVAAPTGELTGDSPYQAALSALAAYDKAAAENAQATETLEAQLTVAGFDRDPALMNHVRDLRECVAKVQSAARSARTDLVERHALGAEYHTSGRDAASSAFRPDGA